MRVVILLGRKTEPVIRQNAARVEIRCYGGVGADGAGVLLNSPIAQVNYALFGDASGNAYHY
jgi:hypothetical protein